MNNWLLNNQNLKFVCCFTIVLLSTHCLFGFEQQKNDVPAIDLQKISINESTEIVLDSGWAFYWNKLIEPGSFNANIPFTKVPLNNWTEFNLSNNGNLPSFGYATYRLIISIPKEKPHISLYIPAAYSSSKTWINGELISEIGRVGTSKTETLHRRFSQIISLDSHKTDFEIVIQVANFYHNIGGFNEPLIIGTNDHFYDVRFKRTIADMIFIGSLSSIGTFFLLFFLFYWNKDKAVLYFGILCISLAYMALSDRYAPFAKFFGSISWILLTKVEYISLFLAGASANLFFYAIFSSFIHKAYTKAIVGILCLFMLLSVFLPSQHFTKLISPFLILMIFNLFYASFVIVKAIISKREESVLLLVSMLLVSIIFYGHIIFYLYQNKNVLLFVNFGYVLVFLLLSMLLMTRFANSFKELARSRELAIEQKREISIKSDQLVNINLELNENLKLLKNYNAELDGFNHIVSHDLKAPLVGVHTLVSFLEEDLMTTLNENTKNHFKLLKDRVSKMDALINGLLEYSKIAKGNKTKELFSINDLLTEVVDVVNNENKHTINLPDNDAEIYVNKIELKHVFQNLIHNSIKHNDKNHVVVNISFSKLPNQYLFVVHDNGLGIDPKYHHKIFDMFSQLNTNNEVESTGIGLAIVKKIVSENNGTISVESEEGVGTTIKFSWEIHKENEGSIPLLTDNS